MVKVSLCIAALLFVSGTAVAQQSSDKAAAPSAASPHGSGGDLNALHKSFGGQTSVGDVKVPKATGPNAKTVAEIVGNPASLKDKNVVVRGKVVKFTPGVLGKNWVHLQDGSGSEKEQTHDVLVTTQDETKIGDVVIASGTVKTDVDLGSGYSYKVLVEDAKLSQ
jgi:hypothetical protein